MSSKESTIQFKRQEVTPNLTIHGKVRARPGTITPSAETSP